MPKVQNLRMPSNRTISPAPRTLCIWLTEDLSFFTAYTRHCHTLATWYRQLGFPACSASQPGPISLRCFSTAYSDNNSGKEFCLAASARDPTSLIQTVPATVGKVCSYTQPETQDHAAAICAIALLTQLKSIWKCSLCISRNLRTQNWLWQYEAKMLAPAIVSRNCATVLFSPPLWLTALPYTTLLVWKGLCH